MTDHSATIAPGRGDQRGHTDESSGSHPVLSKDIWSDHDARSFGAPVESAPLVSIGGGMGSFAFTHILRIAGLTAHDVRVISDIDRPYETYELLCRNSQIPAYERIRSDSGSMMDNIWGFPGYALRETFNRGLRRRAGLTGLGRALAPSWNVLLEPIGVDYYTPRASQVFESCDREMVRLNWPGHLLPGTARNIRRRQEGGYFTVYLPRDRTRRQLRIVQSQHLHVSVGYPGLRFLPDLQRYRTEYGDSTSVVNAYEEHEHVYDQLRARGGTVIVRGSGIVAIRIVQRLLDDRAAGANLTIVHLFRNYVENSQGSGFQRRRGRRGFAYQGFNYPKSGWGGQLFDQMMRTESPEGRSAIIRRTGGTNIPHRRAWEKSLTAGLNGGWYRQLQGEVESVVPGHPGTVSRVRSANGSTQEVFADFIIDGTGLEADPREHRLLADLLDHGGAGINGSGRLDVDRNFEVRGTRSGSGRLYAIGAATLGGYVAPVDSFLGLQLASLLVADDLARQGFCKRIGPIRSTRQWWRWARNVAP